MSERRIPGGTKDENGVYTRESVVEQALDATKPKVPAPTRTNLSIDDLLAQGLLSIERNMHHLSLRAVEGVMDRDDIMTLRDCMAMLHELKKKEKELLDNLSDEELEKLGK